MWTPLARQLRCPSGSFGALAGHVMSRLNRRSNRIAIDAMGVEPHDIVLELGCGNGSCVKNLARIADEGFVLGIDHSPTMLKHAARRNRAGLPNRRAHLVLGRADALPCRSESVDKILAVHLLYFAGIEVLREAKRVLRPGGTLTVLVTDRETMRTWKLARAGIHRLFDQNDLASFLQAAGFTRQLSVSRVNVGFGASGLLAVATKS